MSMSKVIETTFLNKPWSNGYGRRLILQRLRFRIWHGVLGGHFSHLFVVKIVMCAWKGENK